MTVLTSAGEIECDLLVVGVGTVPNTELAEQAGLAVGNGIEVDAYCATSIRASTRPETSPSSTCPGAPVPSPRRTP